MKLQFRFYFLWLLEKKLEILLCVFKVEDEAEKKNM